MYGRATKPEVKVETSAGSAGESRKGWTGGRRQSVRFSPHQVDTPLSPRCKHQGTFHSATSSVVDPVWIPQSILSLDGGGIRGYSSLLILRRLMEIIKEEEQNENPEIDSSYHPGTYRKCYNNPVTNGPPVTDRKDLCRFIPCHYFDYIGGTSTGGLISIMLSRLRMGVDEAIVEYENLAGEIFGHPRLFSYRGPLPALRCKYSGKKMHNVVENVVARRLPIQQLDIGGDSFNSPDRLCKTVCVAYGQKPMNPVGDVKHGGPYLFRSYNHWASQPLDPVERNPGPAHCVPIGDVARSTSAAPTYFNNITIQNRKFGDGAFGRNNPAYEMMVEVGQMSSNDNTAIEMLLSIGTGESKAISRFANSTFKELYTYFRAAKQLAKDSNEVHETMMTEKRRHGLPYHRLNVPAKEGLGEMKMDEWKTVGGIKRRPLHRTTLHKIKEATEAYLESPEIIKEMTEVAIKLVKRRQARSDTPLWDMVSTGVQYRCTQPRCPKGMKLRDCRVNLEKHLMMKHGLGDETDQEKAEMQKWVDAGSLPY